MTSQGISHALIDTVVPRRIVPTKCGPFRPKSFAFFVQWQDQDKMLISAKVTKDGTWSYKNAWSHLSGHCNAKHKCCKQECKDQDASWLHNQVTRWAIKNNKDDQGARWYKDDDDNPRNFQRPHRRCSAKAHRSNKMWPFSSEKFRLFCAVTRSRQDTHKCQGDKWWNMIV